MFPPKGGLKVAKKYTGKTEIKEIKKFAIEMIESKIT